MNSPSSMSQSGGHQPDSNLSFAGYWFPHQVISSAVWLYHRFPLSLYMVEALLAVRSVEISYETVRRWAFKFDLNIARRIRATAAVWGDKWPNY
ncbi:MAG: IS6 family transposase [Burkholderiales bacterium]|nr:IS6 family transposase [Burkholderiales bacterium]MDE2434576.1 IS6 family transposase [Burkholderiales bacterium]